MNVRSLLLLVAFGLLLSGCARRRPARPPVPPVPGSVETGIASWYGHPYHGRRAANGEVYDMEKLTAAHRTLPFDTWVQVLNLTNNKTVTVRINDRGPFVDGRIIDLSRAAARTIEMLGPGTAKVEVEVVTPPTSALAEDRFAVQVGAFGDRANAERMRGRMEARYGSCQLVPRNGDPPLWRVLVGSASNMSDAEALLDRLREDSDEAFVVRLDDVAADRL